MKRFQCSGCGQEVHFDNSRCLQCGADLGVHPIEWRMIALAPDASGVMGVDAGAGRWSLCQNATHDTCNWLVAPREGTLCLSCRHNRTIPDLGIPANLALWKAIELAKRQLFYALIRWGLPLDGLLEGGLTFEFAADTVGPDGTVVRMMTGHRDGTISINIEEADDAVRERIRTEMGEPYRTLLGHFRHEVGHYYWDRLVRDGGRLEDFRAIFGDETADYGAALQRHYQNGAPENWSGQFISAYAAAHPWEDFAETWSHYLHIVDSLETAYAYGMSVTAPLGVDGPPSVELDFQPYEATELSRIIEAWVPFTIALNSINRSMGQRDFYPFVMSGPVMEKLEFVHRLIKG